MKSLNRMKNILDYQYSRSLCIGKFYWKIMNVQEYRKKVLKRTFKRCLITMVIMAIPGIVMSIINRWLILFVLISIIPIIYLIKQFIKITKWDLSDGTIEDVTLYNDFDQPCTEAHINFMTEDNVNHECVFTIGHYGDYEEGIEPELENMLHKDREQFMKKQVPVFYDPCDINNCMVYLEDVH